MSVKRFLFAAHIAAGLVAAALGSPTQAAVITEYDLTGATTATPPVTWAATTTAAGVTSAPLSRGAGIDNTGLTNGFSSNNWAPTVEGDVGSLAEAIAANEYFEFGFSVDPLNLVSLSTMDFSMRRSATNAPQTFELQASLDGYATPGTTVAQFEYRGRSSGTAPAVVTPFQWMTTDTAGQGDGNPITPIDLSTISLLQNVPGGATVTFRLYGWGAVAGVTATNTVALGRATAANGPGGPSIEGTVTVIPEPSTLVLAGSVLVVGLMLRRR